MTRVYDAMAGYGPVTVIAAGDNVVVPPDNAEGTRDSAVQVGFGAQKKNAVNSSESGAFKKAGVEPKNFSRVSVEADLPEGRREFERTQFSGGDSSM